MPKLTNANIIHLLGIESLPLDERKEIVESALELVETRTINRVMEMLNESQRKELTGLFEKEEIDAIHDLLEKNKINLLSLTEEEVEKVKRELLAVSTNKRS